MNKNLADVEKEIKKYHYISSEQQKEFSKKLSMTVTVLKASFKENSDNKIEHFVNVAYYIASWRFDYDMVIASMLHEIDISNVDESYIESIGQEIVSILNNYSSLKDKLDNVFKNRDKFGNDVELRSEKDLQALYIIIADMMDDLENNFDAEKKAFVKEVLIPHIEKIKAFHKADVLMNILFKNDNSEAYNRINDKINRIIRYSENYQNRIVQKMHQKLDPNSKIIDSDLISQQKYIKSFTCEKRTVNSIYGYLCNMSLNKNIDFDRNIVRSKVAIYDLTLIIDDSIKYDSNNSIYKVFWNFYEKELKKIGISIMDYGMTLRNETLYFILDDDIGNEYRCFVRTETQYLYYQYGNIIDKNKFLSNGDNNGKKIKVFRKDGSAMFIDENATVLDFAFAIHTDLGLKFKCAMKNNNKEQLPPYTKLEPGDTIEIEHEQFKTAKIKWFRYAKTSMAINHLSRYFEEQLKNAGLDSLV